MNRRWLSGATTLLVATALVSCTVPEGGPLSDENLTWEEAKAETQKTELEIAELIPATDVVSVVQKPTGTLFSCDAEQHTWYGSTTIEIAPDADAEEIVRALESHFREGKRFDVRTRRDVVGEYELQLMSPETAETYIIGPDDGGATIRIGSGSPCFTLPDDVYPGGTF